MTLAINESVTNSTHFLHPRWRALIGALVVQLILGTVYGYSIFWQPLQSEVGLSQGNLKYSFSICILSFALVMVIAGRVQDVLGPRVPALIGGGLMGVGFLLAGFSGSSLVFYLCHAAIVGVVALVLLMLAHAWIGKVDREQFPMVTYVPMAIMAAVVTGGVVMGNQYVGKLGELDRLFMLLGDHRFSRRRGHWFCVCLSDRIFGEVVSRSQRTYVGDRGRGFWFGSVCVCA